VTAVQKDPPNGPWTVSVTLDAGDNAAAAQSAADKLTAMTPAELATALGLAPGAVSSVSPAAVAVETVEAAVSFGFEVAADAYDPTATSGPTSPAAYAAALAAKMGDPFTAADFTVTAVQKDPPNGPWTVSVTLDAGDNAAAAHSAVNALSAMTPAELTTALGLPLGAVKSTTLAAAAVEYVGVETEKNTVSWGFDVAAGEYDPATSPAAYAAALAAKMGRPFKASDFTVTAVQKDPPNGPWTVSVTLDAGDNAAAAQSAKDKLSATTPAELETALRLTPGSVSSITPATVAVDTAQATVSWSFDVVGDSYDPIAYAAALAKALGDPFKASDITVTAVKGPGGIWSVSVVVNAGSNGAAALRAKAVLSAMTPARLAGILGAAPDSVSSIGTASIDVQYGQPTGSTPPPKPPAGVLEQGPSNQTTADEGPMIGGIIGGVIFILIVLALVYVYLKKRDEKSEAAAWLKAENAKAAGPVIVAGTPGKPTSPGSPKASPALESWLKEAGNDEEAPLDFSGDDDGPRSPGSPKSPSQIFV